jgi:hypothetical protein
MSLFDGKFCPQDDENETPEALMEDEIEKLKRQLQIAIDALDHINGTSVIITLTESLNAQTDSMLFNITTTSKQAIEQIKQIGGEV